MIRKLVQWINKTQHPKSVHMRELLRDYALIMANEAWHRSAKPQMAAYHSVWRQWAELSWDECEWQERSQRHYLQIWHYQLSQAHLWALRGHKASRVRGELLKQRLDLPDLPNVNYSYIENNHDFITGTQFSKRSDALPSRNYIFVNSLMRGLFLKVYYNSREQNLSTTANLRMLLLKTQKTRVWQSS